MEPFQVKRRRVLSDKIISFTRTHQNYTSVLNSFISYRLQSHQFRLFPELLEIKGELHSGDTIFQLRNVNGAHECRTNLNGIIMERSDEDTSNFISEINKNIHHQFWKNINFCGHSLSEHANVNSSTTVVSGQDIYCTTKLPIGNPPVKKSQLLFYYLPELNKNTLEYKFELRGLDPKTNIYPVNERSGWAQATYLLDFWFGYWTRRCRDFQGKSGLRMFSDINLKPLFDSLKTVVFIPGFTFTDYEDLRDHFELLQKLNDVGREMFDVFDHDLWKISEFNITCKVEHLLQLLFLVKIYDYVYSNLGKEEELLFDYLQLYPWLLPTDLESQIEPTPKRLSTHRIRNFVKQCSLYSEKSEFMLGHINDTLQVFAGVGLHLARYGQKFKIRNYPTAFLF